MQIRVVTDQPWEVTTDVLVVPVVGELEFTGAYDELDRRSGGELRALQAFGELRDRRFGTALGSSGELPARRLLAVSAGHAEDLDRENVRKFAARSIRRLINRDVKAMAVWLDPLAPSLDDDLALVADLVARGVVEGGFEPKTIYREDSDAAPPVLDELVLIAPGADATALAKAAERGRIMGEGANVARRLSNRAANDITPQVLADEASEIAAANGLSIDVVDEKRAAELGMGMFLAVGQGSANKPRMIVMRSGDEGEKDALGRHLAMVGKGVCFDSGGISIKPGDRMEEMKMDKTGACTVIAAIATVARLSPGLPLLAVAPAVENMPGGGATRPGDIVKAMNGKWVDIINTDAEGRLILGDAMTYAETAGRDAHRRRRDADRCRRPRVRQHRHGGVRDTRPVVGPAQRRGRPGRRALLADPADQGLHVRDGELVRGHPEHRHAGRLARQERPVPRAVPDGAVGPPRHRRDGLLPQDLPVRPARRDRGHPRDARRARAGGGLGDLSPLDLTLGHLTIGGPHNRSGAS